MLRIPISLCIWGLLAWCKVSLGAEELFDETQGTTVFAFDAVTIPYSQNLRLEMRTPAKHLANPVLKRGQPGSPDAMGVQFYGSVIREGSKFRMWYVAQDDDSAPTVASARWRAAYAESNDGVRWVKPDLGLVEYRGNKHNNLIFTEPAPLGFVNLKVLVDPDDSDPERRYKISTHIYFRHHTRLGSLAPFASADGLRWKMLIPATPKNAELQQEDLALPAVHFEPSGGLYKWDSLFYACGQNAMNATRPYQGRVVRMYHSHDFVHWSPMSNIGFVRSEQHTVLGPGRSLEGEQTHEGISVWNRRNILLGLYGQWHGAKEWKDITVDLGFVVSNDGVVFREPDHEWTFLRHGEDKCWDEGGLLQGQGFENVGDQTLVYYGAWDPRQRGAPRGGVGIATVPRDRFGELVVEEAGLGSGDYQLPKIDCGFLTASLPLGPRVRQRFYLNAEGLGVEAELKIELLGPDEQPLAGYSGKDAAIIRHSGFQTPVLWCEEPETGELPERIRIRVTFQGKKRKDIRFSAVYIK